MLKDRLDQKVQRYEEDLKNLKMEEKRVVPDSAIKIWKELEKHFDTAQAEELTKKYEISIYVFLDNKGEEYDYGYMLPGDVYINMKKFEPELKVSSCILDEVEKLAKQEGIEVIPIKTNKYEKIWKFIYKK